MWILPRQLLLSSGVPDTAVLDLDSKASMVTECDALHIVMLRGLSRPISSVKWKRDSWMRHLYGRILKPSHAKSFTDWWTSSLRATLASHSPTPENGGGRTTRATSGLSFKGQSGLFDLDSASLRTSQDTLPSGLKTSATTWTSWVTRLQQDCLRRQKQAHRIPGAASSLWPTATTSDPHTENLRSTQQKPGSMHSVTLPQAVRMMWPSPAVMDVTGGAYPTEERNGQLRSVHNAKGRKQYFGVRLRDAVTYWPTSQARDAKGGFKNHTKGGMDLTSAMWPTASTRDWKDTPGMEMDRDGVQFGRVDQLARAVYFEQQHGLPIGDSRNTSGSRPELWATPRSGKTTDEDLATWNKRKAKGDVSTMPLTLQVKQPWTTPKASDGKRPGKSRDEHLNHQVRGRLNPRWDEILMGLPMGWTSPNCPASVSRNWRKFVTGWLKIPIELTSFACAETVSCPPPPPEPGELFTLNFKEEDDDAE